MTPQAPPNREASRASVVRPLFIIAAIALLADQVTKTIALGSLTEGTTTPVIDGILHWTLQRNPGAAFSLFTKFPAVFTVLATAISIGIVVYARRVPDRLHAIALGLVLGGALGNLVDRLTRPPGFPSGHVIDFIDLRVWPVFNIADSCVVIGAGLLIVGSWRADRRAREADADG